MPPRSLDAFIARWRTLPRLTPEEAHSYADDIETARAQKNWRRALKSLETRRARDSSRLSAIFDPANAPDSAPYATSFVPVYDGTATEW